MRAVWTMSWVLLISGCWLGDPYDPIQFCLDPGVEPVEEGGRTIFHHTGHLRSDAWNDESQDPLGVCGASGSGVAYPEWIFRIEDDDGRETRWGYSVPELERSIDKDDDDLITLHAVYTTDPTTFGFVVYNGVCDDPAHDDCVVEMVADDGLGGRVIEDELIAPYNIKRTESLARRNGDCGKAEHHTMEFRGGAVTISLQPGQFDVFRSEHAGDTWDAYAVNVDNHTWDVDSCGDAAERFSYVVMRSD